MIAASAVEATNPRTGMGDGTGPAFAPALAGRPDDPLSQLEAAVDAVDAEGVEDLSDAALGEDLRALRRQIDRLEAGFCRRLRRFDALHGAAAAGAASTVAWLRGACRMSGGGAALRLETARRLDAIPDAEAAFGDGRISTRHAAVLARCVSEVGPAVARDAGPALLEAAGHLDPDRLRLVTRHLRHCADPDGTLRDAERDHRRRWLQLSSTLDGAVMVDGMLDAEGGATLRAALGPLSAPSPGDGRLAAQRRADALVELATRQLQQGGLPGSGGERPHLTVTVEAATLRGDPWSPAAELGGRVAVPAETVRRLACDAAVTEITLGARGEPLSVGRTRRTVPPSMRRALVVRDRHCRFPGCDRPPEWTDGHHLRHWATGGETRLDNLILLCRAHHRFVHEGGWRLEVGEGGDLCARPP